MALKRYMFPVQSRGRFGGRIRRASNTHGPAPARRPVFLIKEAGSVPNDNGRLGEVPAEADKGSLSEDRSREQMRLGYVEMAGINLSIARENAREDFVWPNITDYWQKSQ
jgi:hypothetical protein